MEDEWSSSSDFLSRVIMAREHVVQVFLLVVLLVSQRIPKVIKENADIQQEVFSNVGLGLAPRLKKCEVVRVAVTWSDECYAAHEEVGADD